MTLNLQPLDRIFVDDFSAVPYGKQSLMKAFTAILLAICLTGALIELTNRHPKEVVVVKTETKTVFVRPTITPPTPTPEPSEPAEPDLSEVKIEGQRSITNAVMKQVTPNGILFRCDQGLVEARFVDLDPAFKAYYAKFIKTPSIQANTVVQVQPVAHVTTAKHPRKESLVEEDVSQASSEQRRLVRRAYLKKQMDQLDHLIDAYTRQNKFKIEQQRAKGYNVSEITEDDYNAAVARRNDLHAQYDQTN